MEYYIMAVQQSIGEMPAMALLDIIQDNYFYTM
jgi:hypothetical protein